MRTSDSVSSAKPTLALREAWQRSPSKQACSTLAAAVLCFSAGPARAQDTELEMLKQRLAELESLIGEQAEKIEALEARQAESGSELSRVSSEHDGQAELSAGSFGSNNGQPISSTAAASSIGRVPDDAIVRAGDFDGAVKVPGSSASFKLGGYAQGDFSYDIDSLGFEDAFNARTVPLDGTANDETQNFRSHARYSRLNFDVRDQTPIGDFRVFIELDFFGDGREATNNYSPVLRHATAQLGNFYVGQWWSNFADLAASPESTVSPLGTIIVRNPGIRYARNFGQGWRAGVGLENPNGDLSGPDAELASDSIPNLTAYVQYTGSWGRVRAAGLALQLESQADSAVAGGVNLSGRINVPMFGEGDNISFAVQAGEGFAHYYATLANVGLEGVIADDGSLEATGILAGFIAYQHWWNQALRSTFYYSALNIDPPIGSSNSSLSDGASYAANLYWSPYENATFGLEFIRGERGTFDGRDGAGTRVGAVARFEF